MKNNFDASKPNMKEFTSPDGEYHFIFNPGPNTYNLAIGDRMMCAGPGFFARWGRTTKEDPTLSFFGPELLDISITGKCMNECAFCYRDSKPTGEHMPVEMFEGILRSLPETVCQIAIGGGEPTLHPEFTRILHLCKQYGIVPNYTTNGIGSAVNDEIAYATKDCCGVVAVSWDRRDVEKTIQTLRYYIEIGCRKVNIHFVLGSHNIEYALNDLPKILKKRVPELNAALFLLYKPAGRAEYIQPPTTEQYSQLIQKFMHGVCKIGFDSCTVPFIVGLDFIDKISVEPCESGRFSMFINEHGVAYPCSFSEHSKNVGGMPVPLDDKQNFLGMWRYMVMMYGRKLKCTDEKCQHVSSCLGTCFLFDQFKCELLHREVVEAL